GDDHGLDPVAGPELGEDPPHMGLHRRLGDEQLRADLLVREAAAHQGEHLPLALGEVLEHRGVLLLRLGGGHHPLEQAARGGGGDHRVPAVHGADRAQQVLGLGVLEQEAAGPGTDRGDHVLVEVEGGQHDDLRRPALGGLREDLRGGLDPVLARHAHIHQHHVDPAGAQLLDGGGAVRGLDDDLHVVLRVDDHRETGADQRLVVDEGDAQGTVEGGGHRGSPGRAGAGWDVVAGGAGCGAAAGGGGAWSVAGRGTVARTRYPREGRGPAWRRPPNRDILSCIPVRPWPWPSEAGSVPCPSSMTSTVSWCASRRIRTSAAAPGPACLRTLVRDSWTRRNSDTPRGWGRSSSAPSISSSTLSPAVRTRSASSGSISGPGCGPKLVSSSWRSTPSRERMSARAARPVSPMVVRTSAAFSGFC